MDKINRAKAVLAKRAALKQKLRETTSVSKKQKYKAKLKAKRDKAVKAKSVIKAHKAAIKKQKRHNVIVIDSSSDETDAAPDVPARKVTKRKHGKNKTPKARPVITISDDEDMAVERVQGAAVSVAHVVAPKAPKRPRAPRKVDPEKARLLARKQRFRDEKAKEKERLKAEKAKALARKKKFAAQKKALLAIQRERESMGKKEYDAAIAKAKNAVRAEKALELAAKKEERERLAKRKKRFQEEKAKEKERLNAEKAKALARKKKFAAERKVLLAKKHAREVAAKKEYDATVLKAKKAEELARAKRKKRFQEEKRKYDQRKKRELEQQAKAARALDRALADEAARIARAEAKAQREKDDRQKFLFGAMSEVPYKQGDGRIIQAVQDAQVADGVKYSISCPRPGQTPTPFAYQRFVSHAVKPNSPVQRLLAVHRTGAGKTLTMVRILENFYEDRRSKAIVFPNRNIAHNFYSELLAYDNRYRTYMESVMDARDLDILRNNDKSDAKRYEEVIEKVEKKLAGTSELKKLGTEGYLVAPIRAFSYGEIGGTKVFNNGKKPKEPLFSRDWNFNQTGNPLDNCIILMDEAHNLIQPGHGCGAFCDNWLNLQEGLAKMQNSVLVGFTATPMAVDVPSGDLLMAIIRGLGVKQNYEKLLEPLALKYLKPNEPDASPAKTSAIIKTLARERSKWAGFTSYYYAQPAAQYPGYIPQECVTIDMTDGLEKKYVEILTNNKWGGQGVIKHFTPNIDVPPGVVFRMQNYCNIARSATPNAEVSREYLKNVDVERMAPKLLKIAESVLRSPAKSLVIMDRAHSMVALTELINMHAKTVNPECNKGQRRCWAKLLNTTEKFDAEGNLIESDENKKLLAEFNDFKRNPYGERIKTLVIDAKTYSEGVSFFGVTELHIVSPSMKYSTHLQQLGRAFRACKFVNTETEVEVTRKKASTPTTWTGPSDTSAAGQARARQMEKRKAKLAQGKLAKFVRDTVAVKKSVTKQTIKVFVYRTLSDEFMTADEYALLRQDESKRQFIADMAPYQKAALDRGLYDKFEGRFKTGEEPTCLECNGGDEEFDEERADVEMRKQAKLKKLMHERIQAQKAEREERLAKRKN